MSKHKSVDPTRINIATDPHTQRMRGVATHGHVPFDVPYMSLVDETLYVGGCAKGLFLPTNIEHVVSLYPWEKYTVKHELVTELSVRMYDDLAGPNREQVEAIARLVNVCRKSGPTLVHCQAGLNRSNLVAATALILDGVSPVTAVRTLRKARSRAILCNPVFLDWLSTYSELSPREFFDATTA